MIIGIGTDIVLVARINEAVEKYGERFLRRIFTHGEREYCEAQKNKSQHYAARFAAKEAFSKAIGTGIAGDTVWTHIEVVKHQRSGEPFLRLHEKLQERYGTCRVLVSLSHTSESAIAMVAVETTPDTPPELAQKLTRSV
ncbi:MAG: holo-[acyl-carrier-protein] synthase [Candidatus Kapaibacterium sp.]|nr:MAG: holo-[acyl-carrier-protein] synthase [Candidatus Kapabacteria bacterium]